MSVVNIGGEERPVLFSRNAIIEFEKITGINWLAKGNDYIFKAETYRALAFVGLKWGLYSPQKGVEPKPSFTLFQVGDWIQENEPAMIEILNVFISSLPKYEKKSEASAVKNNADVSHGTTSTESV